MFEKNHSVSLCFDQAEAVLICISASCGQFGLYGEGSGDRDDKYGDIKGLSI